MYDDVILIRFLRNELATVYASPPKNNKDK